MLMILKCECVAHKGEKHVPLKGGHRNPRNGVSMELHQLGQAGWERLLEKGPPTQHLQASHSSTAVSLARSPPGALPPITGRWRRGGQAWTRKKQQGSRVWREVICSPDGVHVRPTGLGNSFHKFLRKLNSIIQTEFLRGK